MPEGSDPKLPHLVADGTAVSEGYTYPRPVRGPSFSIPERNRDQHAGHLLASLEGAKAALAGLRERRAARGIARLGGISLELRSDPEFQLMLKSLDRRRDGIELLSAQSRGSVTVATVFVGEGKLERLERLVNSYRTEDNARSGRPRNQSLVESISDVRMAALESFWTDEPELLPASGQTVWWEVWLRIGSDRESIVRLFRKHAAESGVRVEPWLIEFFDRTVVLAWGTPENLSESVELLDCIAELRLAKDRPDFFMGLQPSEQADWVKNLVQRLQVAPESKSAVCLLDTGVNRGHPVLQGFLAQGDLLSCDPSWGQADHHGHGTEMAGLALLGDLTEPMASPNQIPVEHVLESVKVLPPAHLAPNDRDLYGAITQQAVARVEVQKPERLRVFCMAVSAPDFRDRGLPSSWSAAVDASAAGDLEGEARLFVLSAGNVDRDQWRYYPDRNDLEQVHDPGQAWNALTVGAVTNKIHFDQTTFPGWRPVANPGGLSPSSTTSVTWLRSWPVKPDVVLEGGNAIREPTTDTVDTDDPLLLLTTYWRQQERLLTTSGDTSAAAAQAARMAAILRARYPSFWPETVRALIVHSADWTEEMLNSTAGQTPGSRTELLLARYGYGVPDLDRASWSASNALTLVVQDRLQPFERRGGAVTTKDMNLHWLPWPTDQLLALGSTAVELRVSLSYFIEPNPARRGWVNRFRYQSHGLRFTIKAPTESVEEFRARVSRDAQTEENTGVAPADPGWRVGRRRNRGSIHSDRWTGTAADLAARSVLAVFPVGGWWKEQPSSERWRRSVRYALIVSIKTPDVETDIYTAVANQISVGIEV